MHGDGESLGGEVALRDGGGAGTEFLQASRPEGLVPHRARHRDGRNAGARRGGGSSGAAMMGDSRHFRKEPIMRRFTDGQYIDTSHVQAGPAGLNDAAHIGTLQWLRDDA